MKQFYHRFIRCFKFTCFLSFTGLLILIGLICIIFIIVPITPLTGEIVNGTYFYEDRDVEQVLLLKPNRTFEQRIFIKGNQKKITNTGTYKLVILDRNYGDLYLYNYYGIFDASGELESDYSHEVLTSNFICTIFSGYISAVGGENVTFRKVKDWEDGDFLF